MRKTIISAFLFVSMIACYKDNTILHETPQDPLTKAQDYLAGDQHSKMKRHKITTHRALKIAEEAKGLFADENERQIKIRSVGATLTPVAITNQTKARSAGVVDTLMFLVNYPNNNGFVFVSNDDRDGEILMYADNGSFAMQDTAGNIGLKMHLEMMLAYQQHKLNEIKSAESRGEAYTGDMTTRPMTEDDLSDMLRSSATPNDTPTLYGTSGMPGELSVHTCNVSGMPGSLQRQDICAPATYESKYWEGDTYAIDLAQKKYKNQKCFGVPVSPPPIDFMTGGNQGNLGTEGEAPPCKSAPYCTPPLWNYGEYYNFYGCKMGMHIRTQRDIQGLPVQPLLTTYWDQGEPLMHGSNKAGCGPIAMAQLMVYHNMPKSYGSQAFGGTHRTEIDELRKLKTNNDIANSHYCYAAQNFLQEIRVRLNVDYNSDGSTSTNSAFRMKKVRDAFESFGYIIGYNNGAGHHGVWDYFRDYNFPIVVKSILNKKPVYIRGNSKGGGAGHQWLLDGYKEIFTRYYYADYYFDEYGKFNAENKYYTQIIQQEYVHANMGWGHQSADTYWIARGIYVFEGNVFNNELYYIAGIYPGI